jgi:hypothetical protein
MSNSNNKSSSVKKPFCKVCYDAKKNESVYTSHFVKDQPGKNGVVVCPILLSQECRYCHAQGHTPSCCPKLQNELRSREMAEKEREKQQHKEDFHKSQIKKDTKNESYNFQKLKLKGFSILDDSGSDLEDSIVEVKSKGAIAVRKTEEVYPRLSNKKPSPQVVLNTSYANMVAKTNAEYELEQSEKEIQRLKQELEKMRHHTREAKAAKDTKSKQIKAAKLEKQRTIFITNWADMESSSDEEDEEDEDDEDDEEVVTQRGSMYHCIV